jgi:hypothetical protein
MMPHPFFCPPARFYIIHVCLSLPHFHFVRCCCIVHRSTHILPVHSAFTAAGQTHVYTYPPLILSSHQCTVGPPLCSVAFFIVCVFVCCFAPLVGPPHHQHHQRFSFYPFFGGIVARQTHFFNLLSIHTVSS